MILRQYAWGFAACCVLLILSFAFTALAQKVIVLAPDDTDQSRNFARNLEQELIGKVSVLDNDLGKSVFNSTPPASAYNMTAEESKRLGTAIGCGYMILTRSAVQRRIASLRPEYYEGNAAIFIVSSKTGRLIFWRLQRFDADKPSEAKSLLDRSIAELSSDIATALKENQKKELSEPVLPFLEEPPESGTTEAKNLKAPIPFRRIKPEYTSEAAFYDVAATIDIVVDLDASGKIMRTEITRWAGYGLDESVEKTVRSMNWRAAERNGKPLPMRFLLRYNFKRIEKEDQ